MKHSNPYLTQIYLNLPRLLSLINTDQSSKTYGVSARDFWSWKLIDYPNASFQTSALGLLNLSAHGLLPEKMCNQKIEKIALSQLLAIETMQGKDGGLNEAFPNEGSFCVTGLVLSDLIESISYLEKWVDNSHLVKLENICEKLASFLLKQDEHHGIISNHLATTALGLTLWHKRTGDPKYLSRASMFIDRIVKHQNAEGWLTEYSGADPGYQSWALSSLARLQKANDIFELGNLMNNNFKFIHHFTMPNGSFSNGLGSRMTKFLFPGGCELMAAFSPYAADMAFFARKTVNSSEHVNLSAIDQNNLPSLFNDYCLAAVYYEKNKKEVGYLDTPKASDITLPSAGYRIIDNASGKLVVNVFRGGQAIFCSTNLKQTKNTPPPIATDATGRIFFGTDGKITHEDKQHLVVEGYFTLRNELLPGAFKFIVLRLLSVSFFKNRKIGNLIKRILAYLLINRRKNSSVRYKRLIFKNNGSVKDVILPELKLKLIKHEGSFSPTTWLLRAIGKKVTLNSSSLTYQHGTLRQ